MSAAVKLRDEMGADELRAMARRAGIVGSVAVCWRWRLPGDLTWSIPQGAACGADGEVHAERRRRGSSAPWLGLMRRKGNPGRPCRHALSRPARLSARAGARQGGSPQRMTRGRITWPECACVRR